VWFGGVVLVFGGVIVMWPGAGPTKASLRRALPGYAVTLAGEVRNDA
jgi:hypothetical protein